MLLPSTKMSFWSKKKIVFRLSVAAILLLVLDFLTAYATFDAPRVASLTGRLGMFPVRCSVQLLTMFKEELLSNPASHRRDRI